jgi:hypothetical protein
MVRRSLGTLVVFVASAFVLASPLAIAQAPPPTRLSINIVNVKPEALNDWLALQEKETIPALKKAGIAGRTAWTTANFGEGFQYFFTTPIDKFATYDNPLGPVARAIGEQNARVYNEKLRRMIVSQQMLAINILPESIVPPPTYQPKFMVANFTYVTPGRAADYVAFLRDQLMPVIRKAKPVGYALSRTVHGGDANEFVSARYIEKMADLDGPNLQQQVLGAKAPAVAPAAGIVQRQERRIYRYVPNLSFTSAAGTTSRQ